MDIKRTAIRMIAFPLLTGLLIAAPSYADSPSTEAENRGNRLEDDAWYDVSEWFDGNDYNPTDEAIGRWDDERFHYADNRRSDDSDNDSGNRGEIVESSEFYGAEYDDGNGRFSDIDRDGYYESYSRYFDGDSDDLYDSYATYRDENGDGSYDDYQFSAVAGVPDNAVHSSQVVQRVQKGLSGKQEQVAGKITEQKAVRRLGQVSQLFQVKSASGESIWVDMGPQTNFQLFPGDSLTAMGPIVQAGEKQVLVATEVEFNGKQRAVQRMGRRYSGTIESTQTAKFRGQQHLVAKIKTDDGKRMTVDMGKASNRKQLKQGDAVSVTGVPVKVGDRVLLIADTHSL